MDVDASLFAACLPWVLESIEKGSFVQIGRQTTDSVKKKPCGDYVLIAGTTDHEVQVDRI